MLRSVSFERPAYKSSNHIQFGLQSPHMKEQT